MFNFFLLIYFLFFNLIYAESEKFIIKAKNIKKNYDYFELFDDVNIFSNNALIKTEKLIGVSANEDLSLRNNFDFQNALFQIENKFRGLDKQGNSFYGNSLLYDKAFGISKIINLQIFPSDFRTKVVLADNATRDKNGNTYYNNFFCAFCLVTDPTLYQQKKENKKKKIEEISEIKKPKFYPTLYEKEYNNIRSLYSYSPISIRSKNAYHNTEEQRLYLKNLTFHIFGLPIFYLPRYSISTDPENGDSGFIFPLIRGYGLAQQAFEIPFYFRFGRNIDLTIARLQFSNILNQEISNPLRIGASGFSGELRHLISKDHGQENYYTISAFMTDRTALFSSNGTFKTTESGLPIYGYRGFVMVRADIALSRNTFFYADYKYYSDPALAFFYNRNYTPYNVNTFKFTHLDQNQYHSIAMIEFAPISFIGDRNFAARYMPTIISRMDFKEKKFGGMFYYDFLSSYTYRDYGYRYFKEKFDFGYNISKISNSGIRTTFDIILRQQYHNATWFGGGFTALLPQQLSLIPSSGVVDTNYNRNYVLGNYLGLLNSGYYSLNGAMHNFGMFNMFTKLQFDYPILINSKLGETIINPIIALRYNPILGTGRPIGLIVEDGFNYKLNSSNIFSTASSNIISIFNYGASTIYGINLNHKFIDDFEISGSIAQQYRFYDPYQAHYFQAFSGLKTSLSHIVGDFMIRFKTFFASGEYRLDSNGNVLEFSTFTGISYIFEDILNARFAIIYTKSNHLANFFNRNIEMMGPFLFLEFFERLRFTSSLQYSFSNAPSPFFPIGKIGMTMLSLGLIYKFNCANVGITYMQNNMTVGGIPPISVLNFIFQLKVR